MNQHQHFRGEDPEQALAQVEDQIRNDPANAKHRIYLFQLLSILGRWDRALTQLNVLEDLDSQALPMVLAYRQSIQCEALRRDIFSGQRSPVIFGQPEEWTALLLEALRLTGSGEHSQARELRARAFEQAPATAGSVNDEPFEWIADGDSRLGPMLEVVINGRYAWVPFHRIKRILVEEPVDLRDLVWIPASFTWSNGGDLMGMIPTRYPGTEAESDQQLLLSRKTSWNEVDEETYLGLGQRMLATNAGDYALMDIRQIELDTEDLDGADPQDASDG